MDDIKLPIGWKEKLSAEFTKDYMKDILSFVSEERKTYDVFPSSELMFSAFNYCDYDDVKVVLLGQDPYHDINQAHGLCFSVLPGVKIPPSLRNIYKELASDIGCDIPKDGYLEKWASQGMLMINAVLTVRAHQAASHSKIGWQGFTDEVIRVLNERDKPVIFVLWGNFAKSKSKLITNERHYIIQSAHPSPLSARRGFFGSKPFTKINHILESEGIDVIDW